MGSGSDYLEIAVLDHVVGKTAFSIPTVYLGLSTADPLDSASGLAEPIGNGYARLATAGGDWDAAAAGATANAVIMTLGPASGGAWGTITHFALFDAVSGGNMLMHAALDTPRTVADTDSISFAIGALDITLD